MGVTIEIRPRMVVPPDPPTPRPRRPGRGLWVAGTMWWLTGLGVAAGISWGFIPVRAWAEGRSVESSADSATIAEGSAIPPTTATSRRLSRPATAPAAGRATPEDEEPLATSPATSESVPRQEPPEQLVVAEQRPFDETPDTSPAPPPRTTCEGALKTYREEIQLGGTRAPADITREQFASILEQGSYFRHCDVPTETEVDICAAVQLGSAVGVTVQADPPDAAVERCVTEAVYGLRFPASPRLDVTHTRFR